MSTDDSSVNSQIVDAVSNVVTLTTGQSPSQAFGMLDAVLLETLGMAMHNAVSRQQSAGMINSAALTAACAKILAVPFPVPPPPPPPAPTQPPDVHPLPGPDESLPPMTVVEAAVKESETAFGEAKAALDELKVTADTAVKDAGDAEYALDQFAQSVTTALSKPGGDAPNHGGPSSKS
ncbi:RebB family R body protein [Burkholderia mayonis]|uniref:Translation initiation factor 2 n=1 Tax=Burkholderia mayonis TaxID=1385591 RepID=A0A1B4G6J9_9BURK|nr:RebB family R body protein [Burkholderia mayonis]AOJ11545.1 hypothetical protein WS71_31325 [Burkholderia mayonis]KVE46519.1 hypothetical protein WS71_22480 [Burkholderia mayonis]